MKRDWVMNFLKWQILLCKPLASLWMPFNICSSGINFILLLPMRKWKMFTVLLVRSAVSMTKSHPPENPQALLPAVGGQSCGCTDVQFGSDRCTPVASYWETQMRILIVKGYSKKKTQQKPNWAFSPITCKFFPLVLGTWFREGYSGLSTYPSAHRCSIKRELSDTP